MFQRISQWNRDCEWNFEQFEAEGIETGCWAWRARHTWSAPSAVLILLKSDCWFWSALQILQKYPVHQVWVSAISQPQGACHSFIAVLFSRCPFCGEASRREGERRAVRGEVEGSSVCSHPARDWSGLRSCWLAHISMDMRALFSLSWCLWHWCYLHPGLPGGKD